MLGNGRKVGDAMMVGYDLKKHQHLVKLKFAENEFFETSIGKYMAEALKVNETLTWLDLSSNDLTYVGNYMAQVIDLCEALKVNSALRTLDLKNNFLTAEGARLFADALTVNRTLTDLDLSVNSLSTHVVPESDPMKLFDDMSGVIKLTEALKTNSTLQILNLADNRLGTEGAKHVADMLTVNKRLSVLWEQRV